MILPKGTRTLAEKMIKAIGQSPWERNCSTPEIIVDGWVLPRLVVVMIGYRCAGKQNRVAAISSAQVRCRLAGRRG